MEAQEGDGSHNVLARQMEAKTPANELALCARSANFVGMSCNWRGTTATKWDNPYRYTTVGLVGPYWYPVRASGAKAGLVAGPASRAHIINNLAHGLPTATTHCLIWVQASCFGKFSPHLRDGYSTSQTATKINSSKLLLPSPEHHALNS